MSHSPENSFCSYTPLGGDGEWVVPWLYETKLTEEVAYTMLVNTFAERLAYYRGLGPQSRPWVVPFCYNHEDAEDATRRTGALWIPGKATQDLVNYAGNGIHHALIMDLEKSLLNTGMHFPMQRTNSWIDLRTDVPQIPAHGTEILSDERIRQQVETDFNIQFLAST